MEIVKASINLGACSIQLEGTQPFVEKYLDSYRPIIERWLGAPTTNQLPETGPPETDTGEATGAPRERKRPPRVAGVSCSQRVRSLISENYFAEPRASGDVAAYLKDTKGFNHTINQVSASLIQLVKSGQIRRIKEEGKYRYVNP